MSDVPEFDPNQPFEKVGGNAAPAPEFDESKPFTKGDGSQGGSGSSGDFVADALTHPMDTAKSVGVAAGQVGRNIPVAGPAVVKAGHGLAAFLSRITPDSALPPELQGKTLGELYNHFDQQDKDTQAKLYAEHPVAANVGALGGGLMAPIPGGGMKGLAGAATRVAGATGMAAADTALRTDGDLDQTGHAAGMTAAIAGGLEALPYVGKLASPLVRAAGEKLSGMGERSAFKAATGNQAKAWDDAGNRVNDIGRQLLDNDIVTFGSGARTIADRAKVAKAQAGADIGRGLEAIDQLSAKAAEQGVASPALVDGSEIAKAIRDRAGKMEGGGNKTLVGKLNEAADYYEEMGQVPLTHAQTEKNSWVYKPGDAIGESQQARNLVKGAIGDAMESAIGRLEETVQGGGAATSNLPALPGDTGNEIKGTLDAYKETKNRYGAMAAASKNSTKLANRLEKNQRISLGDKVTAGVAAASAAGAAAMHGGPVALGAAVAGGAASHVLRHHGDAMAAVGLDKIGSMLEAAPEAFGKFSQTLQNAQQRGPQALAVTHYLLSQDPEYQKVIYGHGDGDDASAE